MTTQMDHRPHDAKRPPTHDKLAQKPSLALGFIWLMIFAALVLFETDIVSRRMILALPILPAFLVYRTFKANPGLAHAMRTALIGSATMAGLVGIALFVLTSPSANASGTQGFVPTTTAPDSAAPVKASVTAPDGSHSQATVPQDDTIPTAQMADAQRLTLWAKKIPVSDYPDPKLSDTDQHWLDWVNGLIATAPSDDLPNGYSGPYQGQSWVSLGVSAVELAAIPQVGSWDTATTFRINATRSDGSKARWIDSGPGESLRAVQTSVTNSSTGTPGSDEVLYLKRVKAGDRWTIVVTSPAR